jgi:hypothetical protein
MKAVPDIFINPEHQKDFDTKGFVKIPFLDQLQIDYLDKLFDQLHSELPSSGFIAGSYSSDWNYKKKASDEIVKIFTPSYEKIFKNYKAFGGSFLFKVPSENSDLVLHQDWTIVDESKFVAINCWVPLCDTSINNGTLMVLPGAHNGNFPVHRAPTLNFFFTGNEDVVKKHLVPMNARAGEAVILNQSLVHYSPPNKSNKVRKAITSGVKSAEAPMIFYFKDSEKMGDSLGVYDMEENFLIMFDDFAKDIFKEPKYGKFRNKIQYRLPQPSKEELEKLVSEFLSASGYNTRSKQSLFSKIKSILSFAE